MKKSRFIAVLSIGVMSLSLLTGCGKKDKKTTEEAGDTEAQITATPISNMDGSAEDIELYTMEGMVRSDLTGEWIEESLENKRPVCIMINNIIDAMPQSGISQADITYEFLVEGGITRLLCVFKDYANGITKLGPIRSARHYYITTAYMLDGFFAHYGASVYALDMLEHNSDINNLNGMALDGIMCYRDNSRVAPHNVYTDSEKLVAGVEKDGYDTDHKDYYKADMFKFNYEDKDLNTGKTANTVTTAFNANRKPWFEYHPDDKRYYRFQYGEPHIDDQTNEQLSYKNIIVMFVSYSQIDDYGCLTVNWDSDPSSGWGYYITNGEFTQITWEKSGVYLKYYNEDGTQLKMNPGNTYITVFDQTIPEQVTIE